MIDLFGVTSDRTGTRVDGVIGYSDLQEFALEIGYQSLTIALNPVTGLTGDSESTTCYLELVPD